VWGAVQRDLTLDPNIHLLALAFELPDIQAAMRRKAHVDATVLNQVGVISVFVQKQKPVGKILFKSTT
jgi:hypothetical protein